MSKALCPTTSSAKKERREKERQGGMEGGRKEERNKRKEEEDKDRQADRQPVGEKACGGSVRTHRLRTREQSRMRKES